MQKQILIRAYANLNLGDDLFIKILCDRYPEEQFSLICSRQKSQPFEDIKNLKIIYPIRYIDGLLDRINSKFNINEKRFQYLVQKFDAVVHIGGSIFMENEKKWVIKADNYQRTIKNSNHFFVIGSNFGPYNNPYYKERYKEIFNELDDICFRDNYSYELFSDLSTVRLAPDVVFSLKNQNSSQVDYENYVVISVIDLRWRHNLKEYTDLYEESIIEISKKLKMKGKNVVLMSFCESEGDETAITRIISKYSDNNLFNYFYKGNISEALAIIQSSQGVISTRFHSLILGLIFNKTTFPFIYSNKTLNTLKDINYDKYYVEIASISSFDSDLVVNELLYNKNHDVSKERIESEKQFLYLDRYLK